MSRTLERIAICRAAGLPGWVAECQYDTGETPLDLDVQARGLQDCIDLVRSWSRSRSGSRSRSLTR